MARLYRLHPDSSYLTAPRVFARVFCDPGTLPATVRFYEALTSVSLDMDMDIPGIRAARRRGRAVPHPRDGQGRN